MISSLLIFINNNLSITYNLSVKLKYQKNNNNNTFLFITYSQHITLNTRIQVWLEKV